MIEDQLGLVWCRPISNLESKRAIAKQVALNARHGDVIGAGSGSTSFLTVLALGERVQAEGLAITIVPSSIEIELACSAIGLGSLHSIPNSITWCFDGADEVDPTGRMIKGRGGALYRERLILDACERIYIVADESKSVARLGQNFPVPVEVDPSCIRRVQLLLSAMPNVTKASLRMATNKDGPVITEFGRVLFDVWMKEITEADERTLNMLPGVCGSGIFSNYTFSRVSEVS